MLYDGGELAQASALQPRMALQVCCRLKQHALVAGCPLCMREVNMLRRRDEVAGKICFVDIDAPEYDPSDNAGITYEQGMANIHAILPDGKVVINVEVGCMRAAGIPGMRVYAMG